jgi:hypothetical protein
VPKHSSKPTARAIPFDNTSNSFVSTNTQNAIEEINSSLLVAASPGFTWGRSGNVSSTTWLQNDTVPSNKSGRTVMINSGTIVKMSVATEDLNTYNIQIFEHDGNENGLTLLHTESIISTRSSQISIPNIPVTLGRQLAIKLSTGSAKNLVVGLIIKGTV